MRNKIDYGIYLGLGHACMSRMEKGMPVIKKIDVTDDSMPCCVYFNRRGGIVVGASAYRSLRSDKIYATKSWHTTGTNACVEFQRTMGSDKVYHSKNMEDKGLKADYTSEELSAEVLKVLKSYITDETFRSVVITVPAEFNDRQKNATKQAAKLAGFDHCELLQEPIAASLAYGISSIRNNGYWMVFDFDDCTFNVALIKAQNGSIQVVDTNGDNYLGGNDLDYAIVDEIIIPYLKECYGVKSILADAGRYGILRDAMKSYAEDLRNKLSFLEREDVISNLGELGEDEDGEEIELDFTVTQEQAFDVMRPFFQKAVDMSKALLERNSLKGEHLDKLILAGGPTRSSIIRDMLCKQVSHNIDFSVDPTTCKAIGAALYASTIDSKIKNNEINRGIIRLNVGYESASVETTEWVSIQLDKAATGANCPDKVFVELISSDKTWSSGKTEIDADGNVVEVHLQERMTNLFSILTFDEQGTLLECIPNDISIIQTSESSRAPLSYYIGIELWDEEKKKLVFQPIEGLEKNKPLPATGSINGLKTTSQLRPRDAIDRIIIPIYQADEVCEGISSTLYEHVADVVIDGNDVNQLVPLNSTWDLTIKADTSEMMTFEAYFPSFDLSISKTIDTSKKLSLEDARRAIVDYFAEAERNIARLERFFISSSDLYTRLLQVKSEYADRKEVKMVLQHLKEVMREIEKRDNENEHVNREQISKSSLPYYLCTDKFNDVYLRVETVPISGLEKGVLLPASGKITPLKFDVEVGPNDEEIAQIPIFEVDSLYVGQYAWLCKKLADIIITGDCLDFVIPKETDIEIEVHADTPEKIVMKGFVPELGRSFNPIVNYNHEKPESEYQGKIKYEIRYGYDKLNKMLKDGMDVELLYSELKSVDCDFENIPTSEKEHTLLNIKAVLRKIDKLDNETIFERRKINLIKGIARARELRDKLYNKYSFFSLSVIEREAKDALEKNDPKLIRKKLSDVEGFLFTQNNRIKKDEDLRKAAVLLDINVLENLELHKAYASISIDKDSDYQILEIRICRNESKLAPNRWTSDFKKINKSGSVIELDMPLSHFAEYEISAYTETGSQIYIYPSIIIIDKNNNLNNYKYGKN